MYIVHHVAFSQWHMQHTLHSKLTLKISINMYHKCEHIYETPRIINTSFHSKNIQHYPIFGNLIKNIIGVQS
jgi:hypothetical protein